MKLLQKMTQVRKEKNIVWLKEVLTHDINEFHGDPGPNISFGKEDPIEIFGCLFEDELFEHIVYHTNLYATQKLGGSTAFKPTNADEIKKFLVQLQKRDQRCCTLPPVALIVIPPPRKS